MIALQSTTVPLFTDDLMGFVKIVSLIVGTVLIPLAALIVYFLKRSDTSEVAALRTEINGLGARVNSIEQQHARLTEQVATIQRQIAESQRDVMQAITASGEAQLRAVHSVEVQVARLEERNDLGACLQEFGRSIERLTKLVIQTRGGPALNE